jgi:hypothetical protein
VLTPDLLADVVNVEAANGNRRDAASTRQIIVPNDYPTTSLGSAVKVTTSTTALVEEKPVIALRNDGGTLTLYEELNSSTRTLVMIANSLGLGPSYQDARWHYEYDKLSRVTYGCSKWDGVNCLGDAFTYAYDGAGNLTRLDRWNSDTSQVDTVRYVYNGANQITCVDDASAACS